MTVYEFATQDIFLKQVIWAILRYVQHVLKLVLHAVDLKILNELLVLTQTLLLLQSLASVFEIQDGMIATSQQVYLV